MCGSVRDFICCHDDYCDCRGNLQRLEETEMSTLNYLCKHDVSDEDCYKCMKYGIMFSCPANCEYFEDVRSQMTTEMLKERERLMKQLGVSDPR